MLFVSKFSNSYTCSMGSKNKSSCLFVLPLIIPTLLVCIRYFFYLLRFCDCFCFDICEVKSILHLSCGMILWCKQGIKVPKARLDIISHYFRESKTDKYFSYLINDIS